MPLDRADEALRYPFQHRGLSRCMKPELEFSYQRIRRHSN